VQHLSKNCYLRLLDWPQTSLLPVLLSVDFKI
jgi:hypothetical protein